VVRGRAMLGERLRLRVASATDIYLIGEAID